MRRWLFISFSLGMSDAGSEQRSPRARGEAQPAEPTAASRTAGPGSRGRAAVRRRRRNPSRSTNCLEMVRQGFKAEQRGEPRTRDANSARTSMSNKNACSPRPRPLWRARRPAANNSRPSTPPTRARSREREAQLAERLGQMGELFGVVRQVATDLSGQIWDSLISSQLGERKELLDRLGRSKELPHDARPRAPLVRTAAGDDRAGARDPLYERRPHRDGEIEEREVIRAGPFSAFADGRYLMWEPREQQLRELSRQPPSQLRRYGG